MRKSEKYTKQAFRLAQTVGPDRPSVQLVGRVFYFLTPAHADRARRWASRWLVESPERAEVWLKGVKVSGE